MKITNATGPEFDSELGKIHWAFHLFKIDKISTKIILELNTGGLLLGWELFDSDKKSLYRRNFVCSTWRADKVTVILEMTNWMAEKKILPSWQQDRVQGFSCPSQTVLDLTGNAFSFFSFLYLFNKILWKKNQWTRGFQRPSFPMDGK